jgi:hypothetical protein
MAPQDRDETPFTVVEVGWDVLVVFANANCACVNSK